MAASPKNASKKRIFGPPKGGMCSRRKPPKIYINRKPYRPLPPCVLTTLSTLNTSLNGLIPEIAVMMQNTKNRMPNSHRYSFFLRLVKHLLRKGLSATTNKYSVMKYHVLQRNGKKALMLWMLVKSHIPIAQPTNGIPME